MVQQVEELGAKLEAGALSELGRFEEGKVPVGETGAESENRDGRCRRNQPWV